MKIKYRLSIVAAAGAALFLLGGGVLLGLPRFSADEAQAFQSDSSLPRTITVVGEGQISAAPDIAQIIIGVQVSDPDVQVATGQATDDMESLLAALKGEGIAEKDIQTSYYNLYVDRPYGPQGPGGEALYQVSNNVQVTIRNLSRLSQIMKAAIEAGANNISGPTFNLADPSGLRTEARQNAVNDALATATELAELNGVAVGQVVSISEVITSGAYYVSEVASAAYGLGGGGDVISPGEVNVSVQLEITYEILR
jgi:uncharacterized protein